MNKAFFFDFQSSGHHAEFVDHLIGSMSDFAKANSFFAVPVELVSKLAADVTDVNFIKLPDFKKVNGRSLYFDQCEWIVKMMKKLSCSNLFFLNIDPYRSIIGSSLFKKTELKISGILFSPYHRIVSESSDNFIERLKLKLKKTVKRIRIKKMLTNLRLETVFLLDDEELETLLGLKYSNRFKYLPDPISQSNKVVGDSLFLRRRYGLPDDCAVLLSFGAIVPRKNLIRVIEALKNIVDVKVGLLILGKGDSSYVSKLKVLGEKLMSETKHTVVIENNFLSYDEMEFAFASTDYVLALYKSFFCSSGVIGHAAKYQKPLLATKNGVIGKSVKKYELGIISTNSKREIAENLNTMFQMKEEISLNMKAKEYLEPKSKLNFAKLIFQATGLVDNLERESNIVG